MITRICKVCNRSVPLDGLRKSERSLYGRAPHCLECYRAKRRLQWNNPRLKIENRLIVSPKFTITVLERFSQQIKRNIKTGCWEWQGHISKWGYGSFWHKEKIYRAHRFIYQIVNGKVPDGLEIDHLCRNRKCVNIHPLEAVTHSENIKRAIPFRKPHSEWKVRST